MGFLDVVKDAGSSAVDEMAGVYKGSFALAGVIGSVSGAKVYRNAVKAEKTKSFLERLAESGQQAGHSADPDAVSGQAVDQAAVDLEMEKPDNIYIDAQAFAQRMVDSGVSEADLQVKMPEVAEAFVKAAEEGGDVVIPVAQFHQQLSGTAFGQALAGDVRLSQDDLSYNENLSIQDDIKKFKRTRFGSLRRSIQGNSASLRLK